MVISLEECIGAFILGFICGCVFMVVYAAAMMGKDDEDDID